MRSANELMVQYAAYHRDKRNIASHFIGIPMIVFSIGVLLARPAFEVGGITLTPVWIIWAVATIWYLTLGNLALGIAVSAVNGVLIYLAWAEHQVEIVADRGIAALVPAAAWEAICRDLTAGCRAGRPASALVSAVEAVGALLRAHFPAAGPENPDELPNRPRLE